jgi:hypothetical protein
MAKEMFMLCYTKPATGANVVERIFDSQAGLLDYVQRNVTVSVNEFGSVTVKTARSYTMQKYELVSAEDSAVAEPTEAESSGIAKHVTVQSFRGGGTYGVALNKNGVPLGCTCPDFEYRGGFCKHMRELEGTSWSTVV